MKSVNMYWARSAPNFGDNLNPLLVERVFGMRAKWSRLQDASLLGGGSLLQMLAREKPTSGRPKRGTEIHIWGSGYICADERPIRNSRVKYHAVRGEETQKFGKIGHVTLGDPAVLAPLLLDKKLGTSHRLGIVPHYIHRNATELLLIRQLHPDVAIIDVTKPVTRVIGDIAACEAIYSSSLTGLAVADSLNIPNQWVNLTTAPLFGKGWKFRDYYSAYGLDQAPEAVNLDETALTASAVAALTENFEPRPGIDAIREALQQAFPTDQLQAV